MKYRTPEQELEYRRKLSEALTGKKRPEEVKRKISESMKGKVVPEERRRRISETEKGKVVSAETRAKQSEAAKKPVRCINTTTGEVIHFKAVTECAEFLKVQPDYIRTKCRKKGIIRGWHLNYENKNKK